MSGGLDSSVTAALLKEQGYDCVGLYLNVWADPTPFDAEERKNFPQNKCCSIESLMLARSICQTLDMPFYTMNIEEKFKKNVVDFFLEGFRQGETPNPCVRCNKTIKFGAMFDKMRELGCDYLATGHYVRREEKDGIISLHRGEDSSKDQSYFLYNLDQEKLKQLFFPLGDYNKKEVRELAKKFGLKQLEKKRESQGVCFYPEKTYMPFLKRYLKEDQDYKKGKIKDLQGKEIGEHTGLPFYTIGQRKGIGVGGGPARYVKQMDKLSNTLIVGNEEELYQGDVEIRDVNFLSGTAPDPEETLLARIRSHGELAAAKVRQEDGKTIVHFEQPQRAIAAGQSLVLYRGSELVGGGILTWKRG